MDVLGDRPASIRAIGMPVCFETSMAVFRLVVTSSLGSITTSRSSSDRGNVRMPPKPIRKPRLMKDLAVARS